jgi:hypothetical protein
MEQLNLVPLQADTPNVIYYCERLKYADDAIARNLPELLLATMDAVYQVYKQLRDSPYTDHSRQKVRKLSINYIDNTNTHTHTHTRK